MSYKFVTAWGSDRKVLMFANIWCDFSFVSKLTGNAGNYPFCCAGTNTEILFNGIQKLSIPQIENTSQNWNSSTLHKGLQSLWLNKSVILVIKPLGQALCSGATQHTFIKLLNEIKE